MEIWTWQTEIDLVETNGVQVHLDLNGMPFSSR